MASALDKMAACYARRDVAAREWRKAGGKVVGYFCDTVPVELLLAAGFFPLRITGDPRRPNGPIATYLEPVYEGFVLSALDMLLVGAYDFLDFLVIPRSRDSISQQFANLRQIEDLEPGMRLPQAHSFELIRSRSYASEAYNRERLRELKKKLEAWSGAAIYDDALSHSIGVVNENRRLLGEVARLRRADPPLISGVQALQIIGSSMFMAKEAHNSLLRELLSDLPPAPPAENVRLFVEASPLDNLQLYELLEGCRATVVAEDNCWGNRAFEGEVDPSIDPVVALARRYHYKPPCPWVYPMDVRVDYCARKAVEARAQGVVFYGLEWDPAQMWDYPGQKRALDEKGLPSLALMQQRYLLDDTDALKTSIMEFVKTIGRRAGPGGEA